MKTVVLPDGSEHPVRICEENRFTTYVKTRKEADEGELRAWVRHFIQRGIPACIGYTTSGFAVYRPNLVSVPEDE